MMVMRKIFKYAAPGLVLAAGVFLMPRESAANSDYTKRTGKKCVYCHIGDWSSGKFTDAGIYFKEHNSFKGYVAKPEAPKEEAPAQSPGAQSKDKKQS